MNDAAAVAGLSIASKIGNFWKVHLDTVLVAQGFPTSSPRGVVNSKTAAKSSRLLHHGASRLEVRATPSRSSRATQTQQQVVNTKNFTFIVCPRISLLRDGAIKPLLRACGSGIGKLENSRRVGKGHQLLPGFKISRVLNHKDCSNLAV